MSGSIQRNVRILVFVAAFSSSLSQATTSERQPTTAMPEARVIELMAEAKDHLIDEEFTRSIQIYTRLLEEPDSEYHRAALEYLGVAREKNGQLAQAVAEYRRYLERFPGSPAAATVRQRLAAILARDVEVSQRPISQRKDNRWQVYGGVSQDYLRATTIHDEDAEPVEAQSALLTFADLVVDRRGQRFDLHTRINAGFLNDRLSDGSGPGDQGLVSNAYVEVVDQRLNWSARVGRQTLYTDGVLGRFDGLRASYRLRPNLGFNVNVGSPVDSPRYLADSHRQFVGASINLDGVAEVLDFSVFTNIRQNDGIADREAIGGEVHYRSGRWNLAGMVDYDASYDVLNSALLIANMRVNERLEVHTRVNSHALPYLTSRNALIGQPVAKIGDLLDLYTEPQVRTLARDRTANAIVASFGLSASLSESWTFNGDIGYTEIESTIASGGVAGRAESGPQFYYATSFVGSSIVRGGDTTIIGLRVNSTKAADTSTLFFDLRLPFGRSFRFSPRLALSWREAGQQGDQQLIAAPNLRFMYRWRGRYRLELEAGGQWSTRKLPEPLLNSPLYPNDRERTMAYYVNVRWGVNF